MNDFVKVPFSWVRSVPPEPSSPRPCPEHPDLWCVRGKSRCKLCMRKYARERYHIRKALDYVEPESSDPFRDTTALKPGDPADCPHCAEHFKERRLMWAHLRKEH